MYGCAGQTEDLRKSSRDESMPVSSFLSMDVKCIFTHFMINELTAPFALLIWKKQEEELFLVHTSNESREQHFHRSSGLHFLSTCLLSSA